jgi:hypothetical protein
LLLFVSTVLNYFTCPVFHAEMAGAKRIVFQISNVHVIRHYLGARFIVVVVVVVVSVS